MKCAASTAVKYTTRSMLMGGKGWSLMMGLTKSKGVRKEIIIESGLIQSSGKGMISILNGCMVSCEAFVKYGKCLPHQC